MAVVVCYVLDFGEHTYILEWIARIPILEKRKLTEAELGLQVHIVK